MFYSIDRIEGEWAVLIADDTSQSAEIPANMLPAGAGEGSILRWENDTYIYDIEETERRRRAFFERTRRLADK
ncbi:MAG: DUF3006 domain-containing protein [Ruminococcus sp.]|nr:DUF3006 domain-containing protein [Ruminococcus sp.]